MIYFRTFVKNLLQSAIYHFNWINNDWEDRALILQAKNIMLSSHWRAHSNELNLESKEFRVFSQWGDDGIIQYLIYRLEIENTKFIEFGVGSYYESNTHFLLVNNNWSGFVIDGSEKSLNIIKNNPFYWRYDLTTKTAFIDRDNINELLEISNFTDLGLLHIDLDGNDYWILEAINIAKFNPDVLILEYNSNFGPDRKITIPYDPNFSCHEAHKSGQYFGASLSALNDLATQKGYYFVGCTSAGNNAYFLKDTFKSIIYPVNVQAGFVYSKARDDRDGNGNLIYSSRKDAINSIRGMPVYNIETNLIEDF